VWVSGWGWGSEEKKNVLIPFILIKASLNVLCHNFMIVCLLLPSRIDVKKGIIQIKQEPRVLGTRCPGLSHQCALMVFISSAATPGARVGGRNTEHGWISKQMCL
jgi:hypothetical protein